MRESEYPLWCGGMIEFGISRAHNIALASLKGFTIPGDLSSSSKYWEQDIIEPEIQVVKWDDSGTEDRWNRICSEGKISTYPHTI